MEVGLALLAVVAVVGFLVHEYLQKQKRREAMATFALTNGLDFAHRDPFGIVRMPFRFFRQGDGRGVENVVWGMWHGLEVKLFEFWYYTESSSSKGNRSRHYRRFTCSLLDLPTTVPNLRIDPETVWTRIKSRVGFRDVRFESEKFNRTFHVRCRDERFASYVIDPRMMHWLLEHGKGRSFETAGPSLLCACSRLRAEEVPRLLEVAKGFHDHIPNVVWEVYGTGGRDG